jgi:hypothetical protein
LLNNYNNRAAHAKGVICDLPIKNEFQAGVIATLHFKIASRLFRSDAQLDGKRFIVRTDPDRAGGWKGVRSRKSYGSRKSP